MLWWTLGLPLALAAEPALLDALDRAWAGGDARPEALAEAAAWQGDLELAWRVARAHARLADREADPARAAALATTGWEAAREAVRLAPQRVEGHYWGALCAGYYGRSVGVTRAFSAGVADAVRGGAEAAVAIDPAYEDAGPLRLLGCYWAGLPWPLADLEQAEALLRRAVRLAPHDLSNRFFLGELLLRVGQVDEGRAELERVLAARAEGKGDLALQARARALLGQGVDTQGQP